MENSNGHANTRGWGAHQKVSLSNSSMTVQHYDSFVVSEGLRPQALEIGIWKLCEIDARDYITMLCPVPKTALLKLILVRAQVIDFIGVRLT